jgi:isoamylase
MAPLGPRWDGRGTSFAVFSTAGAVELCLLGDDGSEQRLPMQADEGIWSATAPDAGPGRRYGFRADGGPLLADPYARAFELAGPRDPRSLVVDTAFDWGDDAPPDVPWPQTVVYETHVQGLTKTHPQVPDELRGTYAGLASAPMLDHLVGLGVTAVELLPVHQFLTEQRLLDMGLENYWGYSTLGFFAPHAAYAADRAPGAQVGEFKAMVRTLHAAGLEVILDVVYNHTCEGGPGGPAISFRGLADDIYYRHGRTADTTGTGNTLNVDRPEVLRLIMDSLRYWVSEMHVDGFRFDLATTLARDRGDFDRLSAFFDLVYQDPVVGEVKLIAEPWDVNRPDSYQVGRFPRGWAEWNDRYRDDVRDFWRRRGGVGAMGRRLTGSDDLYGADRRGPDASVNFVTAHDGKTLHDIVTYERKHNEANGEDNRDGTGDDRAENFGVEGESDDPRVTEARARQRRNFIATLMVSQGVPMLLGGDERARTQRGNNNAYCQANEISWYDWTPGATADELTAFARNAIALQRTHATLRRRSFLRGDGDVAWFDATGAPMSGERWNDPDNHFIAFLLAGDRADEPADDLLVVLNAGLSEAAFTVPGDPGRRFDLQLDTASADGLPPAGAGLDAGATVVVAPRHVLVAAAPR